MVKMAESPQKSDNLKSPRESKVLLLEGLKGADSPSIWGIFGAKSKQ